MSSLDRILWHIVCRRARFAAVVTLILMAVLGAFRLGAGTDDPLAASVIIAVAVAVAVVPIAMLLESHDRFLAWRRHERRRRL